MNLSISRDGAEIGIWTEEDVRNLYAQGQLMPTDYYWKEGMAEWKELGTLIKHSPQVAFSLKTNPTESANQRTIPSIPRCELTPPKKRDDVKVIIWGIIFALILGLILAFVAPGIINTMKDNKNASGNETQRQIQNPGAEAVKLLQHQRDVINNTKMEWTHPDTHDRPTVPNASSAPSTASSSDMVSMPFRYENSSAQKVQLVGTFNNWEPESMTRNGSIWILRKNLKFMESYDYQFIVDGKHIPDPMRTRSMPDGHGDQMSTFKVSIHVYPD